MIRNILCLFALACGLGAFIVRSEAADDRVITNKEAEEIQAETIKESARVTAGKIQVGGLGERT
jgi:hypothetical protein